MKRDIEIQTEDGMAKAGLFRPRRPARSRPASSSTWMRSVRGRRSTRWPRGWRAGLRRARPRPVLSQGAYGPFDAKTAFSDEQEARRDHGADGGTTPEMTVRDTAAFLDVLRKAGASAAIGTVGYCMGGGRALNAAAAYPEGSSRPPASTAAIWRAMRPTARTAARENQGPGLCRTRRRRPQLPARAVGAAGRGAANRRGRPHHRELCRHAARLVRARPQRLRRGRRRTHWKRLTTFFAETLGRPRWRRLRSRERRPHRCPTTLSTSTASSLRRTR